MDLIADAMGHGAELVALPVERLPDEFFSLRTGLAGTVAQKFVNYRIGPGSPSSATSPTRWTAAPPCATSCGRPIGAPSCGSSRLRRSCGSGSARRPGAAGADTAHRGGEGRSARRPSRSADPSPRQWIVEERGRHRISRSATTGDEQPPSPGQNGISHRTFMRRASACSRSWMEGSPHRPLHPRSVSPLINSTIYRCKPGRSPQPRKSLQVIVERRGRHSYPRSPAYGRGVPMMTVAPRSSSCAARAVRPAAENASTATGPAPRWSRPAGGRRARAMRRAVGDPAQHVQPVGAAVERHQRLVQPGLGRHHGDRVGGHVGRVRDQHVDPAAQRRGSGAKRSPSYTRPSGRGCAGRTAPPPGRCRRRAARPGDAPRQRRADRARAAAQVDDDRAGPGQARRPGRPGTRCAGGGRTRRGRRRCAARGTRPSRGRARAARRRPAARTIAVEVAGVARRGRSAAGPRPRRRRSRPRGARRPRRTRGRTCRSG